MLSYMRIIIACCALGVFLGLAKVEGAFEAAKSIQGENISALLEKEVYTPEEVGNYDLTEIYIAGALLSEGWGCRQDEKKVLQLYQASLEVLRKDPMDIDIVWKDVESKETHWNTLDLEQRFFNPFKAGHEQERKPYILYAIIGDTIRILLQQGQYETALKLLEESQHLSFLKGEIKSEEACEAREEHVADRIAQVVHFYETILSDVAAVDEGYLLFRTIFPGKKKEGNGAREEAYNRFLHNQLILDNVVQGFEQRSEEEKLKALPYVLKSAKLGIPQAMLAMHLYYKLGCGFLSPDKDRSEDWLRLAKGMIANGKSKCDR